MTEPQPGENQVEKKVPQTTLPSTATPKQQKKFIKVLVEQDIRDIKESKYPHATNQKTTKTI